MKVLKGLFFVASLLATSQLHAQMVQLPSVFSDGMVMQQNTQADVWGWGSPDGQINVVASWNPKDTIRGHIANTGKWSVKLPTAKAGGPYTIKVFSGGDAVQFNDVMLGEVWLCSGQSNMEWCANYGIKDGENEIKNATCPSLRIFHVPHQASSYPQDDVNAKWERCTPDAMRRTSASGYFFGRYLTEKLGVPVGIIVSAWGGTTAELWTPAESVSNDKEFAQHKLQEFKWWPNTPGMLYNRMIHPLAPYALAGCIWYQGESNVGTASYARLISTMVNDWRSAFHQKMPFYYVQIAPHTYNSNGAAPRLREQQQLCLKIIDGSGMINISDLVENVGDIHPRDKRAIGERLAFMAMDKNYGKFVAPYQSPMLETAAVKRGKIVVSFAGNFKKLQNAAGLDRALIIAGKDGNFKPAKYVIKGKCLEVSTKGIEAPYRLSYCFDDATIGELRSNDGLPVLPFQTDVLQ